MSAMSVVTAMSRSHLCGSSCVAMDERWGRLLAERGGGRQRVAAAAQQLEPPPPPKSKLASCLLYLFGWGLISANCVQWLAAAAVADGLQDPVM
eukprot:3727090-Lingulodinium_polyedra.AAC.1